jgi:GR25 family glycosyltransferase involved in LPS biosynthesis
MALCEYIAEFMDTIPEKVGVFMIHLARAEERRPIIRNLELSVRTPLEMYDAVEGKYLVDAGHPTRCGIDEGVIRTSGEVGCMASHINIMVESLKRGYTHTIIFEDDCSVSPRFSLEALKEYVDTAKRFATDFQMEQAKELLLLSTCGCYSQRILTAGVKATQHFNGCHAYVISAKLMRATIAFYVDLLKKGMTAPIDGVLPILLRRDKLWTMCPENDTAFFRQNRDIPSYIVSDGTERRQG